MFEIRWGLNQKKKKKNRLGEANMPMYVKIQYTKTLWKLFVSLRSKELKKL